MTELPSSIGNLEHLRYLDLCGNRLESLPEDLCSIYHLQVLNVKWCALQQLPEGMNRLINLRHLHAGSMMISGISQIRKLTNLQKLEKFLNGRRNDLDALKSMTELRGALQIADLLLVKVGAAKKEILKKSKHLTSLWLSWDSEGTSTRKVDAEQAALDEAVLQCLQPHDSLKELRIDSYVGLRSPTWMLTNSSLSNVKSMYLIGCVNWQTLPPLELLPELEILEIKGMHALEKVSCQSLVYGSVNKVFPRLKKLLIDDLPNLKEWTGVQNGLFLSCLCELVVLNCPMLERFPYAPQLENVVLENVGLVSLPEFFSASLSEVLLLESSGSSSRGNPLASMYISKCPNLRFLRESSNQLDHFLKDIKKLTVIDCQALGSGSIEYSQASMPEKEMQSALVGSLMFHNLNELEIRNCPQLSMLPLLPAKLTTLVIENVALKALPMICKEPKDYAHKIAEGGSSSSNHTSSSSSSLSILRISSCPVLSSLSLDIENAQLNMPKQKQAEVQKSLLFPQLSELEIRNCPHLCSLPDLPPTLIKLIIEDVGLEALPIICKEDSSVEAGSDSSSLSVASPSSLSTLYISGCPKLSTLSTGLLQQQQLLTSLAKLAVRNCENLKSDLVRGFRELTALKELTIIDCPKLLISRFYISLRTIEISECFVTQGAWSNDKSPTLHSIETVKIFGCPHVNSDEDRRLKPSDSFKHLTAVNSLYLVNTSVLTLDLFSKPYSLRILDIDGCQRFPTDQRQLSHFRNIRHLSIRNCKELPYLPEDLNTLPSLEELCIESCPLITSLPQNGLPRSLKRLSISGCDPLLKQRCRDKRRDFTKISHIPFICIEGEMLQSK